MYKLEFLTDKNHSIRGVAFLITTDRRVTAKLAFDTLDRTGERTLRHRCGMWCDGHPPARNRYHGWNSSQFNGQYTNCYVFKCGKNNQERFYGFLCKPKARNSEYELCVLVVNIKKKKDETAGSDLRDVKALSEYIPVRDAIKKYFKRNT